MATSGVNVKMGVSGVSQFRADIKKTQDSLKTLDESLKLNEKQFKQTGDAEEYMKTKSELLKGKIEGQKSVIDNCRKALEDMEKKGVDKSSKAFQQMQQQLLRARGDLIDTENELNNIAIAGEEAGNGVDEMNTQLKRIGNGVSYQNVTEGLEKITSGMTKVVTKAWQMGEAIVKATLGAGSWADELKTTAAQYEIDPEQLQRMRKTANLIDTDVDTILSAQQKLRQGVGKRDKEAMGAFAALFGEGYDPTKKNAVDVFWDAGEALMKLQDEYDQQIYAQKLFGKSWRELVPLFTTGRKEYEKTMESWSVVENDQLDALGKMDDQYQKMTSEWETFKMEMLSAFSGPLTSGMETITGLFKQLNNYLDTPEGQQMLTQLGETINTVIDDLVNIDPEAVVGGLSTVVDKVKEGFEWIEREKDNIKNALIVIAGGFAALKLTEVVANMAKIISGFKTLGISTKDAPTTVPTATPTSKSVPKTHWWTPAANGATKILNDEMLMTAVGNIAPVVADRFMNETNAGRAIRDGGDFFKGVEQDFKETTEAIEKNAETFEKDWKENVLMKPFFDLGENSIRYWDNIFKQQQQASDAIEEFNEQEEKMLEEQRQNTRQGPDEYGYFPEDWSIEEIMEYYRNLEGAVDRMTEIAKESNDQNQKLGQNSLTSTDLSQFRGLPAAIARAIENANIRAEVDVVSAGSAMTPVMNYMLGQIFRREYT